jgi:hypothetical protein
LDRELLEAMLAIRQAAAWADPRLMLDHPQPELKVCATALVLEAVLEHLNWYSFGRAQGSCWTTLSLN